MSTIFKILTIAGLAVAAAGATAQAQPYHAWNHEHWNRGYHNWDHRWDHARWGGGYGGYYGPRYYTAPPVVAYPPPAYYGPPSLNFNIPLG